MRELEVVDAGPLTTIQDLGRPGWAHLGVPRAGALDLPSSTLANRLVGNDEGAGVLETTLGGVAVQATAAVTVAVTGAPCAVSVDERRVAFAEPVTVPAGATLVLGPATHGVRSYLAVAGGVAVEPVLGSRSTDTLAGVGPPALAAGALLPVGLPSRPPPGAPAHAVRRTHGPAVLRFLPGPRAGLFAEDTVERLLAGSFVAGTRSNRVALRLEGEPLRRQGREEVPTEGLLLGSVQVPPAGHPLVFLADHPTTGGYPVLGVVHPDDVALCAQVRPGERVSFRRC